MSNNHLVISSPIVYLNIPSPPSQPLSQSENQTSWPLAHQTLRNTSHSISIIYRLKTTQPNSYFASPTVAIIPPLRSVTLKLCRRPFSSLAAARQCNDKFLLLSAPLLIGANLGLKRDDDDDNDNGDDDDTDDNDNGDVNGNEEGMSDSETLAAKWKAVPRSAYIKTEFNVFAKIFPPDQRQGGNKKEEEEQKGRVEDSNINDNSNNSNHIIRSFSSHINNNANTTTNTDNDNNTNTNTNIITNLNIQSSVALTTSPTSTTTPQQDTNTSTNITDEQTSTPISTSTSTSTSTSSSTPSSASSAPITTIVSSKIHCRRLRQSTEEGRTGSSSRQRKHRHRVHSSNSDDTDQPQSQQQQQQQDISVARRMASASAVTNSTRRNINHAMGLITAPHQHRRRRRIAMMELTASGQRFSVSNDTSDNGHALVYNRTEECHDEEDSESRDRMVTNISRIRRSPNCTSTNANTNANSSGNSNGNDSSSVDVNVTLRRNAGVRLIPSVRRDQQQVQPLNENISNDHGDHQEVMQADVRRGDRRTRRRRRTEERERYRGGLRATLRINNNNNNNSNITRSPSSDTVHRTLTSSSIQSSHNHSQNRNRRRHLVLTNSRLSLSLSPQNHQQNSTTRSTSQFIRNNGSSMRQSSFSPGITSIRNNNSCNNNNNNNNNNNSNNNTSPQQRLTIFPLRLRIRRRQRNNHNFNDDRRSLDLNRPSSPTSIQQNHSSSSSSPMSIIDNLPLFPPTRAHGHLTCAVCLETLYEVVVETRKSNTCNKEKAPEKVKVKRVKMLTASPCAHVMHAKCLRTWCTTSGNSTCPVCRTSLVLAQTQQQQQQHMNNNHIMLMSSTHHGHGHSPISTSPV